MTVQDQAPAEQGPAGAMPKETAAWIRAHAWTQDMRATYRTTPGATTTCACQSGTSQHCAQGRHGRCVRGTPQRAYATVICWTDGESPMYFARPYAHQTDVFATGPRLEQFAMVWLADRVCRWVCRCDCHSAPPPEPARPKPRSKRPRKPKPPPPAPRPRPIEDVPVPDALF